jgi:hypothetical protein
MTLYDPSAPAAPAAPYDPWGDADTSVKLKMPPPPKPPLKLSDEEREIILLFRRIELNSRQVMQHMVWLESREIARSRQQCWDHVKKRAGKESLERMAERMNEGGWKFWTDDHRPWTADDVKQVLDRERELEAAAEAAKAAGPKASDGKLIGRRARRSS